jgi:cation transport ATPase
MILTRPFSCCIPAGSTAITDTKILGFPCNQLVKWVLTTPVQFWIGWRFHRGAWKALRRGGANMDVLVSMGTNASYIYSVSHTCCWPMQGVVALGCAVQAKHLWDQPPPAWGLRNCATLITLCRSADGITWHH